MRTTVLLASCMVLVATTTGLLLAIHLMEAHHSGDHDSHDCRICQQMLAVSKKIALPPNVELVGDTPVFCTDIPPFVENVGTRYPRISRPRGPPC